YEAVGLPLTAFVAIRPFDPSQPDDAPERLAGLREIEACYSVAGEDSYLLLVRVASPADLERLLQEIRSAANVTTRTTVVLSIPYEHRPPSLGDLRGAGSASSSNDRRNAGGPATSTPGPDRNGIGLADPRQRVTST